MSRFSHDVVSGLLLCAISHTLYAALLGQILFFHHFSSSQFPGENRRDSSEEPSWVVRLSTCVVRERSNEGDRSVFLVKKGRTVFFPYTTKSGSVPK